MFHCFSDLNSFRFDKAKKIKSLGSSDDEADQIAGLNNDNTLGIPRTNLELKRWSYVHNFFQLGAMINYWIKEYLQLLVRNKHIAFFVFSEHFDFFFNPADKYLFKVKSRNIILICWLWSKSATNTPERCHVVFIFNFEHI